MNLGDRSRRDGLAEAFELQIDLRPERGLDDRDCGLAAHRLNTVLQPFELQSDLGAHDVRARREELSELDVGRPQSIDGPGEARESVAVAFRDQVGEREGQPRDGRQGRRVEADKRSFASEHQSRARQP